MVRSLKNFATKRNLTILMIAHFILGAIGTIIYIAWLNNSDYSQWFTESYIVSSIITHLLGYISPIILLVAILAIDKENSENLFASALITGLVISTLTSFIVPAITGSAFSGGDLIRSIILKVPTIFIIVDIFRKHKLGNVSCILCVVMAALQLIAFIANIVSTTRYGVFYVTSIMPAIISVLHWAIVLLYLIRFIKVKKAEVEEPVSYASYSAEQRLIALKAQFDNGEITEEEYNEIKSIILQNYVGK